MYVYLSGECNSEEAVCTCTPGWEGIGCETGDCSIHSLHGYVNCSGHGVCVDDFELALPYCDCESTYFELDCSEECVHGTIVDRHAETPCVCTAGYTGANCDEECSLHGERQSDGTCICDVGYRGDVSLLTSYKNYICSHM